MLFSVIGLIPTILTTLTGLGTTASSISKDIRDLQIAKEQARSNVEIKKIDAEIQAVHDRKDVLVAEAGSRLNASIRATIALLCVPLLAKIMFFDPVVGSFWGCAGKTIGCEIFRTDAIDPYRWGVITAIIGFYFLATSFGKK